MCVEHILKIDVTKRTQRITFKISYTYIKSKYGFNYNLFELN